MKESMNNDDDHQYEATKQNDYSIWSSGWSANVIGTSYLKECGQRLNEVIHKGFGHKMFRDAELDLTQCTEQLFACADSYTDV